MHLKRSKQTLIKSSYMMHVDNNSWIDPAASCFVSGRYPFRPSPLFSSASVSPSTRRRRFVQMRSLFMSDAGVSGAHQRSTGSAPESLKSDFGFHLPPCLSCCSPATVLTPPTPQPPNSTPPQPGTAPALHPQPQQPCTDSQHMRMHPAEPATVLSDTHGKFIGVMQHLKCATHLCT